MSVTIYIIYRAYLRFNTVSELQQLVSKSTSFLSSQAAKEASNFVTLLQNNVRSSSL